MLVQILEKIEKIDPLKYQILHKIYQEADFAIHVDGTLL